MGGPPDLWNDASGTASGTTLQVYGGGAIANTITAVTGSATMRSTRQLNDGTNGFPALG